MFHFLIYSLLVEPCSVVELSFFYVFVYSQVSLFSWIMDDGEWMTKYIKERKKRDKSTLKLAGEVYRTQFIVEIL